MRGKHIIEDTQNIKTQGYIGYRLEDEVYYLMDFEYDEILESMSEVAFMFDDHGGTSPPALLRHGSLDRVNKLARKMRKMYAKNRLADISTRLIVIQGKIPIKEIDKMLSTTGYIYEEALIIR